MFLKKEFRRFWISFLKVMSTSLVFSLGVSSVNANPELITLFPLDRYSQKVDTWIKPNNLHYNTPILNAELQKRHLDRFYDHFFGNFSPWNPQFVNETLNVATPNGMKEVQQAAIEKFQNLNKPANDVGYGGNFHPHSEAWMRRISNNMNLSQFDRINYNPRNRGIAIDNLHARLLPTEDVHFNSHKLPGQGYPFDNLQMSSIWAGTPVYILGKSKDHNWLLVLTPDFVVWVKANGIARASDAFVSQWQLQAKKYLVSIIRTETPIRDEEGRFLYSTYVGTVFPGEGNGKILVPVADHQGNAVIRHAKLSSEESVAMPFATTPHNFARLIKTLIGRPYGWGNMYFYNDCSAELKSLFTPFGIWLPRQSYDQVQAGKVVDLTSSTKEQRLAYLLEKGRPFMTLVYIGGHIVLYVGKFPHSDGKDAFMAMTYQNLWGLSPKPAVKRVVVGQSAFFPMLSQYPEDASLISMADKGTFQVIYLDQ